MPEELLDDEFKHNERWRVRISFVEKFFSFISNVAIMMSYFKCVLIVNLVGIYSIEMRQIALSGIYFTFTSEI